MQRSLKFVVGVFLFAVLHLGLGAVAHAQGGATGAISGAVLDSSGSVIADAEVQVINSATQTIVRKIPTATDGSFVAPLLPPGSYIVVVNKSGFSEAKAEG